MRERFIRVAMCVIVVGGAGAGRLAHAVCDQTPENPMTGSLGSISASDRAFWDARQARASTFASCGHGFGLASDPSLDGWLPILMNFQDEQTVAGFHYAGSSWEDRGEFQYCDLRYEWAKLVNAGALVMNGPALSGFSGDDRPFHDAADYTNLLIAQSSDWHEWFDHSVEDSIPKAISQFKTGHVDNLIPSNFFVDDMILTTCQEYDGGNFYNTVAYRSGSVLHESWHAWQEKHEGGASHDTDNNPNGLAKYGLCPVGDSCDWYYAHPKSAFGRGDLVHAGDSAHVRHTPNQVQFEYLCDIADYSADWIPAVVREAAAAAAKYKLVTAFGNAAPMFCGSTRPYWTKDRAALADATGTTIPECSYANLRDCSGTAAATLPASLPACTLVGTDPGVSGDCSTTRSCPGTDICEADGCCRPACPAGSVCDVDGCCRTACADPARQCAPEPFASSSSKDDNGLGHCAAPGCDLTTRCCEGPPANCPTLGFYLQAGTPDGIQYAQNAEALYWSATSCHYRGELWFNTRGAAVNPFRGTPPNDFTEFNVPRLPACADVLRQCRPSGVNSWGCANSSGTCNTTTGCCS
jgi:hypothetical protein